MKTGWRQHLPEGWTGDRPSQYCVPGMKFSTIMKVPSTKNGRLIKALSRSVPLDIRPSMLKAVAEPYQNSFQKVLYVASVTGGDVLYAQTQSVKARRYVK